MFRRKYGRLEETAGGQGPKCRDLPWLDGEYRKRSVFLVQRMSISMFAPCPVCAAALIAGSGLSALI